MEKILPSTDSLAFYALVSLSHMPTKPRLAVALSQHCHAMFDPHVPDVTCLKELRPAHDG